MCKQEILIIQSLAKNVKSESFLSFTSEQYNFDFLILSIVYFLKKNYSLAKNKIELNQLLQYLLT